MTLLTTINNDYRDPEERKLIWGMSDAYCHMLKERRVAMGLNRQQFAELFRFPGIDAQAIKDWETGAKGIPNQILTLAWAISRGETKRVDEWLAWLAQPTVIYWFYNGHCNDPRQHGYVGITTDFAKRRLSHQREHQRFLELKHQQFPRHYQFNHHKILYEGTKEECMLLERELRPHFGIGWNKSAGGLFGFPHSKETQQKIEAVLQQLTEGTTA